MNQKKQYEQARTLMNNDKSVQVTPELKRYLTRNKLALYAADSKQEYTRYFNDAQTICKQLQKLNVEFVVLKGFKHFKYVDSNLDVLLPKKKDVQTVLAYARNNNYKITSIYREPKKIMCKPPGGGLKIHIHKEVSWNGHIFLDKHAVFERRKRFRNIPVASPEDDVLINIAHLFFENYEMTLCDYLHLEQALTKQLDMRYIQKIASEHAWSAVLEKVLKDMTKLKSSRSPPTFPYTYSFGTNFFHMSRRIAADTRLPLQLLEHLKTVAYFISSKSWRRFVS